MKPITIYFKETDQELIRKEADRLRETVSGYIRKSVLLRSGVISSNEQQIPTGQQYKSFLRGLGSKN